MLSASCFSGPQSRYIDFPAVFLSQAMSFLYLFRKRWKKKAQNVWAAAEFIVRPFIYSEYVVKAVH